MGFTLRPLRAQAEGQLLAAIEAFDCCGDLHPDDEIAQEVNAFLRDGLYVSGVVHSLSSTYLLLDEEDGARVIGYFTVAVDAVRLTGTERRDVGEPPFPDIGAIRLVMIGVDWNESGNGTGSQLLEAVVGLCRRVREDVAVRFLLADVNPTQEGWYAKRQFLRNRHESENRAGRTTISMRLDLAKSTELKLGEPLN